MGAEEQENELTDVALCYQAMGLPLDASPVEIDRVFLSLTEEARKKLEHSDPALRQEARQSLQLLQGMYEKVRSSITYQTAHKEYLKNSVSGAEITPRRPVHQAVLQKSNLVHCPRCNGSISKGLETCPICKSPLHGALAKLIRSYCTPGKLLSYCLVLSLVALVAVALLRPEMLSGVPGLATLSERVAPPAEVDFLDTKGR